MKAAEDIDVDVEEGDVAREDALMWHQNRLQALRRAQEAHQAVSV